MSNQTKTDFYAQAAIPKDTSHWRNQPRWDLEVEYRDRGGHKRALKISASRFIRAKYACPLFGELLMGKHPAGNYDSWWWAENGGGGSNMLPFAVKPDTKEVFIGLLAQMRLLQDEYEPVLGVPRVFIDPGESHEDAAAREYSEETGDVSSPRLIPLPGDGGNCNNAFHDTRGGGLRAFALQIPWDQLKSNPQGEGFVYKNDKLTSEQRLEGIERYVFVPHDIQRIAALGDLMTHFAYVRWLANQQVTR